MKMSSPIRRRTAGLLMVFSAIAVASYPVRSADKRIVLIAGKPSHPPGMHEFRAGCLLLQKALSSVPGITVQVYDWRLAVEGSGRRARRRQASLDNADAVLIFPTAKGNPAFQGERAKVIDALAAKGVGIGFAHYAVEVPGRYSRRNDERWIGGHYETNFSVNPMWKPEFGKFPNLPSRAASGPSRLNEWVFQHAVDGRRGREGAKSLPSSSRRRATKCAKAPMLARTARTHHIVAASGQAETMMWAYERPDGGSGFGFTGGHTHANWGNDSQRKTVLNALLWIAKVEVPRKGVEDRSPMPSCDESRRQTEEVGA